MEEGRKEGLERGGLTERIIGAAIEVHRRLGPGFLESIYEHALVIELKKCDLRVAAQQPFPVKYDDIEVGRQRLDLLVDNEIIVELKAVKNLEEIHFAVTKSYLRALKLRHGLLLNFNKPTLEIKRVRNPYD
jgi:GxxExxY protein